ncbi:MAG: hypothetical protein LBS28_03365 [Streptococcaceae bacterium]|jgi:acyl carrier protein|nr:hypothetical protein [Streptococcaceae bacterium]
MKNKNRLLELLKNDESFTTKLSKIKSKEESKTKSKEEIVSIIKKHFADYSLEELDKNLEKINNDSSFAQDGELNMDSLDKIAGGMGIGTSIFLIKLLTGR